MSRKNYSNRLRILSLCITFSLGIFGPIHPKYVSVHHFTWFINVSAFKYAEFVKNPQSAIISLSLGPIYFPSQLSDFFTSKFGWLGPAFIYWVRKFSRPNVGLGERESESRKEQVGGCFCWRFLLMVCARRAAHSLLFPPTKHRQPTCTHTHAAFASVPPGGVASERRHSRCCHIKWRCAARGKSAFGYTRFARFIILERV